MRYADPTMCHGWHRIPHRSSNTNVIDIPDRYASIGAAPCHIQVQLCPSCMADYRAHPADYQEGRRVIGGAQNEEVSTEGAAWAAEGGT